MYDRHFDNYRGIDSGCITDDIEGHTCSIVLPISLRLVESVHGCYANKNIAIVLFFKRNYTYEGAVIINWLRSRTGFSSRVYVTLSVNLCLRRDRVQCQGNATIIFLKFSEFKKFDPYKKKLYLG